MGLEYRIFYPSSVPMDFFQADQSIPVESRTDTYYLFASTPPVAYNFGLKLRNTNLNINEIKADCAAHLELKIRKQNKEPEIEGQEKWKKIIKDTKITLTNNAQANVQNMLDVVKSAALHFLQANPDKNHLKQIVQDYIKLGENLQGRSLIPVVVEKKRKQQNYTEQTECTITINDQIYHYTSIAIENNMNPSQQNKMKEIVAKLQSQTSEVYICGYPQFLAQLDQKSNNQ
jgi:hypothetical protein